MAPIILVMFLLVCMLSMCQSSVDVTTQNGYNEEKFQDYADDQYALHFSDSDTYEDNLLIVVLTEENNSDFYYIAWVGDHIATSINHLMGNNSTALGSAMNSCINESNYKYSLDSNLADVMRTMTQTIADLGLDSSFTCSEARGAVTTDLVNYTDLPMTEATVENALEQFADTTGISVVIVVEEAAAIFGSKTTTMGGKSIPWGSVIAMIVVIVIFVIIVFSKRKPKNEDPGEKYRRQED